MRRLRGGFTLVDLLVSVGIIAILVALLMPALGTARRAARSTACLANLHQLGVLMQDYAINNRSTLPSQVNTGAPSPYKAGYPMWDQLLRKGHHECDRLLLCPGQDTPGPQSPPAPYTRSYSINSNLAEGKWPRLVALSNQSDCILLVDSALSQIGNYAYSVLKEPWIQAEWDYQYNVILAVHQYHPNVLFVDFHAEPGTNGIDNLINPKWWEPQWTGSVQAYQ